MDYTSNLPWWDDRNAVTAALTGLRRQCRQVRGWPSEAGPSPTSGERTALHDRIARTPGLLAELERFGVEFPSSLRDEADQAVAAQPMKSCCQCGCATSWRPRTATDGLGDRCRPCIFLNAARDRANREQRPQTRANITERVSS